MRVAAGPGEMKRGDGEMLSRKESIFRDFASLAPLRSVDSVADGGGMLSRGRRAL